MIERIDKSNPDYSLIDKLNEIIDWINNKQNWHDKLSKKCDELLPQINDLIDKNTKDREGSSKENES